MTEYFTITRTLDAPRELVFDVLTNPEHFAVWFGTAAVAVPSESLEMDVRVGGRMTAIMVLPDGNRIQWAGEYLEVDPPSHLAMTLTDNPQEYAGIPVLFDLEEVEGRTLLTIRQDRGDFSQEQVDATIAGYNAFIDDMVDLVEAMPRA